MSCKYLACFNLAHVSIPTSVTSVGRYAFAECYSLTTVIIPNSVIFIGDDAFWNSNIHTLIFNAVNCEEEVGFLDCPIEKVIIGDSVRVVPHLLVNNFPLLDVFCYSKTPPTCYEDSFSDYSGMLHVPAASLATYFTAPYWQNFNEIVGDAVKPDELTMNLDSAELVIGETLFLSAAIIPSSAMSNIIWYSENPAVATIDNGAVTAISAGDCNIKAICFDKEVVCHVVVYNDRITLDRHEAQLLPNHILRLTPTSMSEDLPALVVTSSDLNVAAARVMNGKVQVVGVAEGTATITVGSADGSAKTDSCVVTVYTENGDVNCDGFVNITDVTVLISAVMGENYNEINLANADMNGDGTINITDVTMLINAVMAM